MYYKSYHEWTKDVQLYILNDNLFPSIGFKVKLALFKSNVEFNNWLLQVSAELLNILTTKEY